MLFNLLLDAANEGTQQTTTNGGSGSSWVVWVIFGVMIVGMILLTVLPNRKRQKEYQKMQDEIRVGTKIMTIGRMVGVITKIYPDGTMELDVGTPGNPVIITITREAIGVNMTVQEQMKAQQEAMKNKKNGTAKKEEISENNETSENGDNTDENVDSSENVTNKEAVTANQAQEDSVEVKNQKKDGYKNRYAS